MRGGLGADPADDEWAALIARLKGTTRTVTYRRPGCGGLDPLSAQTANGLHSVDSVVAELDGLLVKAGISGAFHPGCELDRRVDR